MAQGYYALEEAAQILNMPSDDLKQMARKGEIRAFQDRGTWRFRVQDIQELRRRGLGSDPDLVLGESLEPKPTDSPAHRHPPKSREEEVFDFNLPTEDEDIGVGADLFHHVPPDVGIGPKSGGPKSASKIGGPRSAGSKGPKSPPPAAPGSDSDVRLVADGSDINFELSPSDSSVGITGSKSPGPRSPGPRPSSKQGGPRSKSGPGGQPSPRPPSKPDSSKKSSKVDLGRQSGLPPAEHRDSGVRLVPMDSDSNVKIVGTGEEGDSVGLGKQPPLSATDSDIRLERRSGGSGQAPPPSGEGQLTEEIDLDEELRQAESQPSAAHPAKPRPASKFSFPTQSPFELSEPEFNLPEAEDSSVITNKGAKNPMDSSSDFELTPAGESSSPIDTGSDNFSLEAGDEGAVELGARGPAENLKGTGTGISLENPADSGISLEEGNEGSDEIEFELNLDTESTPKPGAAGSSSEFELALDDAPAPAGEDSSSSEFELTLDDNAGEGEGTSSEFELTLEDGDAAGSLSDSDSEFELTLDDSGGLSPLAEDESGQEEKDIFEQDLEVSSLDEESGSQAVALEDEETSDFDLALDDQDANADEESGSEAIALDDEVLADDEDRPRKKAKGKAKGKGRTAVLEGEGGSLEDLELDGGDITVDEEEEANAPVPEVVRERIIKPAPWGAVPVLFLVPCVAVMFMVGIMGFELLQSMSGYKSPGLFTKTVANMILPENQKLKN